MDRAVHAQEGSMDAVEVGQDLFVKGSEFLVQANRAVIFFFGAFFLVGTAFAMIFVLSI